MAIFTYDIMQVRLSGQCINASCQRDRPVKKT